MSNPNGHNPQWGPGPGQQQWQQPPQGQQPQQWQQPQGQAPQGQAPQQWQGQQAPQQWQGQQPQQSWPQQPGAGQWQGQQQPPPQQATAQPAPRAASRAGRSKLLPVMVAAGLAVGVFAGLMIVRGTGSDGEAEAAEKKDEVAAAKPAADDGKTDETAPTDQPGTAKVEPAVPATPPPPDAMPEPKKVKLTLSLDPADAEATMAVDSKPYNPGETVELEIGDKDKIEVKVVAKADGYKTFYKTLELGEDMEYTVELEKERKKPRKPHKPRKPRKPRNPSDLLDF